MTENTSYNIQVVRWFAVMTVVWGIVGMAVGVLIEQTDIADLQEFIRRFYIRFSHLTDMNQTILFHADIHKSAEIHHIPYCTL